MTIDTLSQLPKVNSGIEGLDEITGGGLPANRPTLVCGNAGCGKTLLGMQFLVQGAVRYDEPGVFMSFEENLEDLALNVGSIGYDLPGLIADKQLYVDHIDLTSDPVEQSGAFDLEGLFVRMGAAIDSIDAKRVVIDTIDVLFARLPDSARLRSELQRLFSWLKQRKVTVILTGEAGEHGLSRHGLEEYVSDCVILLDHRVNEQLSARRLRIVKYRGSNHGTNEYPFLIGNDGITILPVTSLKLDHEVLTERIGSGVESLDRMLNGKGYYRGSSILISGTSGTGKTSFAGHFADAVARRGEKVLYFAYEESAGQIIRNMNSIGLDLKPMVDKGLVKIQAVRPTATGLESHLINMMESIRKFEPDAVIVDPLNSFVSGGDSIAVKEMMARLLDYLKSCHITAVCNSLTSGDANEEATEIGISSLMDTWLLLRHKEVNDMRNYTVTIIKSRGMRHSTRVHPYRITDQGLIIEFPESQAMNNSQQIPGDLKNE